MRTVVATASDLLSLILLHFPRNPDLYNAMCRKSAVEKGVFYTRMEKKTSCVYSYRLIYVWTRYPCNLKVLWYALIRSRRFRLKINVAVINSNINPSDRFLSICIYNLLQPF